MGNEIRDIDVEKTAPDGTEYFEGQEAAGGAGSSFKILGSNLRKLAVTQTITNGVTTTAPSEDAVFDALATKETAGAAATVASNLAAHIGDTTDAHAGTAITNTPAGNISATTVQAAINELDTEKKPLIPRVQTVTSSATVTPNLDTDDAVVITAQATGLTIANPTGTKRDMYEFTIRIKDNGTARAISFGTEYRVQAVALPITTVVSKYMTLQCLVNSVDTKIDVMAIVNQI